MFKLEDGRRHLFQWDVNVRLLITEQEENTIEEVHFDTSDLDEPLTVKVIRTEDKPFVYVPNILLQDTKAITVYAYGNGGRSDTAITYIKDTLTVSPRKKPSDYVYTETEILSYKKLLESLTNGNEVAY